MGAIWIAGLLLFLVMSMLLTLTLCRCAAIADRDAENYLSGGNSKRDHLSDQSLSNDEEAPATGLGIQTYLPE